jgi:hypothetical protein
MYNLVNYRGEVIKIFLERSFDCLHTIIKIQDPFMHLLCKLGVLIHQYDILINTISQATFTACLPYNTIQIWQLVWETEPM